MVRIGLIALGLLGACTAPASEDVAIADTSKEIIEVMSLAGSEWSLADADSNADGVFIQFQGEGRLSGGAGCNVMNGTYTQDGKALSIGPIATTRKLCPAPIMDIERRVLAALRDVQTIEASHLKLRLMGETGETLLDLKRNDWD